MTPLLLLSLSLACGGDDTTTGDDSATTETETDSDTDSDSDTDTSLISNLTSKTDLYLVTDSVRVSGYAEDSVVAYCNDTDDIVVTGGCEIDSKTKQDKTFLMDDVVHAPVDTSARSGWRCRLYMNSSTSCEITASAVCLTIGAR